MISEQEETIVLAKGRIEAEMDVMVALQAQRALWETSADANS